jgi:hypothetical protein
MSYVLLTLSVAFNCLLVWYILTLLGKLRRELEVRIAFKEMLSEYAKSLENIYKLEELYGEEIIKRAINETRFVIDACEEFKKALEVTEAEQADSESPEEEERPSTQGVIKLREGESVSQDAASYRRVVNEL